MTTGEKPEVNSGPNESSDGWRRISTGSVRRRLAIVGVAGVGTAAITGGFLIVREGEETWDRYMGGERREVPGFVWSDKKFPPFRDEQLRRTAPKFVGDRSITNRYMHPVDSHNVAVIGALAADVHRELGEDDRLGFAYRVGRDDEWHQGMGEPGQVFGRVINYKGTLRYAAALGIGPDDVQFTWAMRKGSITTPLDTVEIDTIPRSALASHYPGVTVL